MPAPSAARTEGLVEHADSVPPLVVGTKSGDAKRIVDPGTSFTRTPLPDDNHPAAPHPPKGSRAALRE